MRVRTPLALAPSVRLLVFPLFAFCAGSVWATVFDFQELSPGGRFVQPSGISNSGIITGSTVDGRGFVMDGGNFRLFDVPGATSTRLEKVNASGTMAVGTYSTDQYATNYHAFQMVLNGPVSLLPDLPSDGNRTLAWDVTDSGTIVGEFSQPALVDPARTGGKAFSFDRGLVSPYAAPSTNYSSFHGTNDFGKKIGVFHDSMDNSHGFLLDGDVFSALPDPGGMSGIYPMDINNPAQIVGFGRQGSYYHGWLLEAGAYEIVEHPLAASRGDTYITGINDAGQMVGYYSRVGDYSPHGFLATPRGAVPEPGALSLLITVLPCWLLKRRSGGTRATARR